MALSGSDLAYKQARSGLARCGAIRSNYFYPVNPIVSINGTDRTSSILRDTLHITQNLNDQPDTCRFTIKPSTLYGDAVRADEPESYWRLSESSGDAADSVGAVTATDNGTLTYGQTGPLTDGSTAILFDGSTGYFSTSDVYDFNGTVPFTVECWIKLASNHATQFVRIVSKEATDGSGTQGWWLGVDPQSQPSPRKLAFIRRLNGGADEKRSTTQLTLDVWTHVVGVYTGTELKLYINGAEEGAAVASTLSVVNHANALTIGRSSTSATAFLHGTLSDVAIYDVALSATQIADHYAQRTTYARPSEGQQVIVGLGTSLVREFGGQILRKKHIRRRGNEAPWIEVECIDWQRLFDRRLVTTYYENQSASEIVASIVDTYTSGFTHLAVEQGLPTIDFLPSALDRPSEALRRIANIIGGGFYIDHHKDVHFFGSSGETGTRRPTPPLTLVNSLPSLKSFTHEKDASQVRTRVLAETKGAQTVNDVAAGQTSIPVETAEVFAPTTGTALVEEYGTITYGIFPDGNGTTANGATATGATSLPLIDFAQMNGVGTGGGWALIGGRQYIYYTNGSGGSLTGIPATGPGAIQSDVASGEAVINVPYLTVDALTRGIPKGTYVATITERNDAAAQAALALIEGGDGIHESTFRDRRFDVGQGDDLGDAELSYFSESLLRATWETEDMNARPGTQQVINLTVTDAVSATLTIIRSELFFPAPNYRPRRRCEGATVRLATVQDVVMQDVRR